MGIDVTTLSLAKSYIKSALGEAGGTIKHRVVDVLPETGEIGTLYFVPNDKGSHDEYMYIQNVWELLGNTGVSADMEITYDDLPEGYAKLISEQTLIDIPSIFYTPDKITGGAAYSPHGWYIECDQFVLNENKTYTIILGDEKYICKTAQQQIENGYEIILGENNLPFWTDGWIFLILPEYGEKYRGVKLTILEQEFEPIFENFIPNTIARMEDLSTKTSQLQNDAGFASDWNELNNKPFHYDELKIIRKQDIQPYEIIINNEDWNYVETEDDEGSIIESYREIIVDCSSMGYLPVDFKEFRDWWDDGRPEGGASARRRVPMYLVFENYNSNRPNPLLGTNFYLTTDINGECQDQTYIQSITPCGNISYRFEVQDYIWDEETGEVLQEEKLRLYIRVDAWAEHPNKIIFSLGWISPQKNIPEELLENSVSWDMLRDKPFCDDDIDYHQKIGSYDLYFDEDQVEEDPETGEIIDEWPAENPLPAEDEQYTFEISMEDEILSNLYYNYYKFFIQKDWSFDDYSKDGYEVKEEVDERENNIFTLYWPDDCPCVKTEFVGLGLDEYEPGVNIIFTFKENIFETYTYYSFFLGDNYYNEYFTQLDEKYIPDTIARKSELTWNTIENKPFGEIGNYELGIIKQENIPAGRSTYMIMATGEEDWREDLHRQLGIFNISVNDETVKCFLYLSEKGYYDIKFLSPQYDSWVIKAGQREVMFADGWLRYLQINFNETLTEDCVITVERLANEIKQLDDYYIPDNIARIGNISAKEIACSGEIDGIAFTNLQEALNLLIIKLT